MPSKFSNRRPHAWGPNDISRLRKIQLPEKLKCNRCNKNLFQTRYSDKQLTDLRHQIDTIGRINKLANCQNCTGVRVVEIECTMCNKTLGLDEFAKSQRNNPDTAKCYKCVQEQVETKPFNEDRYENEKKPFITADHSDGKYPEYWSSENSQAPSTVDGWTSEGGVALFSQPSGASVAGSVTGSSLIDTDFSYTGGNGNGGQAKHSTNGPNSSWHTKSYASTASSANSKGKQATLSISESSRSYSSNVAERSETSDYRPCGWPKIKAYCPPSPPRPDPSGPMRPMGDALREVEADANPWYEDGDDEDEDEEESDGSDDDSDGEYTVI